jgi:hypothetical protein
MNTFELDVFAGNLNIFEQLSLYPCPLPNLIRFSFLALSFSRLIFTNLFDLSRSRHISKENKSQCQIKFNFLTLIPVLSTVNANHCLKCIHSKAIPSKKISN